MGLAEDTVPKPYILYITTRQKFELKKFMNLKKWDIGIFFRIEAKKRQILSQFLEEESKVEDCVTPGVSGSKTYQVRDTLFKEVTLEEEINHLCNELVPHVKNISVERKDLDKSSYSENLSPSRRINLQQTQQKLVELRGKFGTEHNQGDAESESYVSDKESLSGKYLDKDFNSILYKRQKNLSTASGNEGISESNQDVNCIDEEEENSNQSRFVESENSNTAVDEVCGKSDNEYVKKIDNNSKKSGLITDSAYVSGYKHSRKRRIQKKKPKGKLKSFSERISTLKCKLCEKAFASQKFFDRHVKSKHSAGAEQKKLTDNKKKLLVDDNVTHVCSICQKHFSNKYGLQAHMKHMHTANPNGYQCDLCGAIMKFKGNLVQHMKSVHTDTRPHHCKICDKSFKVLIHLKRHERRHNPGLTDTCTVCDKTVKKGQMSAHLKRHSDDRKHTCSTCGKRFFDKQDLDRHLRIHSGERPYKCSFCAYASTVKGNLKKHIIHKHRKEPNDCDFSVPKLSYCATKSSSDTPSLSDKEHTTLYVLESTEMETGTKHIQGQRNNGRTSDNQVGVCSTIYSDLIPPTLSTSQSDDNSEHFVSSTIINRPNLVQNNSYKSHGLTHVYNEDSNIYYSMRPVMRSRPSVDQTISSSNIDLAVDGAPQYIDNNTVDRVSYGYIDNTLCNTDFHYSGK